MCMHMNLLYVNSSLHLYEFICEYLMKKFAYFILVIYCIIDTKI